TFFAHPSGWAVVQMKPRTLGWMTTRTLSEAERDAGARAPRKRHSQSGPAGKRPSRGVWTAGAGRRAQAAGQQASAWRRRARVRAANRYRTMHGTAGLAPTGPVEVQPKRGLMATPPRRGPRALAALNAAWCEAEARVWASPATSIRWDWRIGPS